MDVVTDQAHFDAVYAERDDPWRIMESWYESRKRAILSASLPQWYYGNAYEPGCGPGGLTELLAPRCGRLVASDLHDRAVTVAQRRVATFPHVTVTRAAFPEHGLRETFDLIVISELGYYFAPSDWTQAVARLQDMLTPNGTVVACHWKHDFEHRRNSTEQVHLAIAESGALHRHCRHDEPDFLLEIWCREVQSVAAREHRT